MPRSLARYALPLVLLVVMSSSAGAQAGRETYLPIRCSGDICFTLDGCDRYVAARRDEGRRAPACRERPRAYCVTAYLRYDDDDGLWCHAAPAGCAARVRDLQRANRRAIRHPYQHISECFVLEHVELPPEPEIELPPEPGTEPELTHCFEYLDGSGARTAWCSVPGAGEQLCARTRSAYAERGWTVLTECAAQRRE